MTATKADRVVPFVLLIAACALLFLGGLGRLPLLGRDEALYAEAGREMLASGDWITPHVNGAPFFEKPPLYYWLAALSYRALGVSPFAARLPAALMAILTVALTAAVGARVWGRRAGLLAGIALASSLQMAIIGRMGIMDVPLTCLTVLALLSYERWWCRGGPLPAIGFGVCVALAVLLKGAAGFVPLGIAAVDALVRLCRGAEAGRRASLASVSAVVLCVAAFAAVAAPWFLAMGSRHGEAFGSTLFLREHLTRIAQPMQGHGGPVWYYLGLIAVSFFPWVMFLPAAVLPRHPNSGQAAFWHTLAIVWILAVLVPFSLIRTKLPGYVTPLFPAMALLVGRELDRRLQEPGRSPWIAVIVGAVFLSALVGLLPVAGAYLGARVNASHEAWLLVIPVAVWVGGYGIIALGAAAAVGRRAPASLGIMTGGQTVVASAVLIGILPVISPYLGGGPARLAQLARRELPGSQVVLYDMRPETVAFVLGRPVPVFPHDQEEKLMAALRSRPTALLAPAGAEAFWGKAPIRRIFRSGDSVLLDIPTMDGEPQTPSGE